MKIVGTSAGKGGANIHVCVKINFKEKGARWECVNKKLVATFSKSSGLAITDDISSSLFKDQAAKAAEAASEAKAKTLKGFQASSSERSGKIKQSANGAAFVLNALRLI